MNRFIGRKNELIALRKILNSPSASVIVYGKRKVGKTTLIRTALKTSSDCTVYYECLKAPLQDNVTAFVAELYRTQIIAVPLAFTSFIDVFAYLNSLGKTFNIVIDEYPYLKEFAGAKQVDSAFQTIIDNHIGHIRLFISGSHIGMMKDMLSESNALYGRFSLMIQLKELDYLESAEFYPEKSIYDKIALYSVFGGSPFVNSFVDGKKTLKYNIINTILNPFSPIYSYAEHLLISDFTSSVNAERIMFAIANGKKKYSEIEGILGMKNNGLLSKQLNTLIDMEIVTKSYPINKAEDKKKISYELNDNILRFYYAFVYKNKSALTMLGAEAFYDEYLAKPIITFISHRFEELCRTYFSLCAKCGKLPQVHNIGTYYYDDPDTKTNGEFDVVLARNNSYDIYEVKYHNAPMTAKEMLAEAEKIKKIKGLPLTKIGFISAGGFSSSAEEFDLIDGNTLYNI